MSKKPPGAFETPPEVVIHPPVVNQELCDLICAANFLRTSVLESPHDAVLPYHIARHLIDVINNLEAYAKSMGVEVHRVIGWAPCTAREDEEEKGKTDG